REGSGERVPACNKQPRRPLSARGGCATGLRQSTHLVREGVGGGLRGGDEQRWGTPPRRPWGAKELHDRAQVVRDGGREWRPAGNDQSWLARRKRLWRAKELRHSAQLVREGGGQGRGHSHAQPRPVFRTRRGRCQKRRDGCPVSAGVRPRR